MPDHMFWTFCTNTSLLCSAGHQAAGLALGSALTMSPPVLSDLGYVPPDGGWGWAVVFGASISIGFAFTFPKAFTIYFKEIQAVFSVSYSQIAWTTSIMCATTYGGGKWSKAVSPFGKRGSDLCTKRGGCISFRKFLASASSESGFLFSDDVCWQIWEHQ